MLLIVFSSYQDLWRVWLMPPVTTYALLAYEAENMTNETIQGPMTYFARFFRDLLF